MLLGQFNRHFAKHGRITFFFIFLIIGIPFIFLFDINWAVIQFSNRNSIGTMYGASINREQFAQQVRYAELDIFLNNPNLYTYLRNNQHFLNYLHTEVLHRLLILNQAKRHRIDDVSDEELINTIQMHPLFQKKEGRFDTEQFQYFKKTILPQLSMTAVDFDQYIKESISINRIKNNVTQSINVTEAELWQAYQQYHARAQIHVAHFYTLNYLDKVKVDEKTLKEYFEANIERFTIPEQKSILAASFPVTHYIDLPKAVNEKSIQDYYHHHKKTIYKQKEIKIRYILMRIEPNVSKKDKEKKRNKLTAIRNDIIAKKLSFEKAAILYSEDQSTASKGGWVDYFAKGEKDKAFEDTAFSLKNAEISKIIATSEAYYLIKKIDGRSISLPYQKVKAAIKQTLLDQEDERIAKELYSSQKDKYQVQEVHLKQIKIDKPKDKNKLEKATQTLKIIRDRLKKAKTSDEKTTLFAEIIDETMKKENPSIRYQDRGYIDPNTIREQLLKEALLQLEIAAISEPITSNSGIYLLLKVGERQFIPFNELKAKLIEDLRTKRYSNAQTLAQQYATEFSETIYHELEGYPQEQKPAIFKTTAQRFARGLVLRQSDYFDRNSSNIQGIEGSSNILADEAFKLSEANPLSEIIQDGENYYIILLTEHIKRKPAPFKEKIKKPDTNTQSKPIEVLSDQAKKAKQNLELSKAKILAMEDAKTHYKRIQKQLEEGLSFSIAQETVHFSIIDPFTFSHSSPPPPIPQGEMIQKIVQQSPINTLSEPHAFPSGILLVYFDTYLLPEKEVYQKEKNTWKQHYLSMEKEYVWHYYLSKLAKIAKIEFYKN